MDEDAVIKIASELAELRGSIATFMKMWQTQDDRAVADRSEVKGRLDDLRLTVAGVMRSLADITEDLSKAVVRIVALEELRDQQMSYGWAILGKASLVIGGAALTGLGWLLVHLTPALIRLLSDKVP